MNSKERHKHGTSAHEYFMFQEMDFTKKGKPVHTIDETINGYLL